MLFFLVDLRAFLVECLNHFCNSSRFWCSLEKGAEVTVILQYWHPKLSCDSYCGCKCYFRKKICSLDWYKCSPEWLTQFLGGNILANLNTFRENWVTKQVLCSWYCLIIKGIRRDGTKHYPSKMLLSCWLLFYEHLCTSCILVKQTPFACYWICTVTIAKLVLD